MGAMKFNDNQALRGDVRAILEEEYPTGAQPSSNRVCSRILDAFDRHLPQASGPLLRNDANMIVAVADKFREARGDAPWSTANLPGKDTEFARFVLTMIDGWLAR
jgi:hypothetical protein